MAAPPPPPGPPPPPMLPGSAGGKRATGGSLTSQLKTNPSTRGERSEAAQANSVANTIPSSTAGRGQPSPGAGTLSMADLLKEAPIGKAHTPPPAKQKGTTYQKPQGLPKGGGTLGTSSVNWSISGPQQCSQQTLSEFKLTAKDDKNQLHEVDANLLEAVMWRDGVKNSEFCGTIKRQNRGVFILQFRPAHPGIHFFNVWIKGALEKKPIYDESDPVKLNVLAGSTIIKENIYFSLAGLGLQGGQVGVETSFEITVKGDDKQPRDIETEKLSVVVAAGIGRLTAYCSKKAPGRYVADFTPNSPGEHTVIVTYGGQQACSSKVTYDKGVDASKSEIVNAPSAARIGEQTTFTIQARTESGNEVTRGGERFDCGVSGPAKGVQGLVVRDELTGKYTVRFTLVTPGTYKFFVSLGDVALRGSPFAVTTV